MKKIIVFGLICLSLQSFGQSDEDNSSVKKGFDKTKLFSGGTVDLGFSSYSTVLGIDPQFGCSVTDWADVGVTFNLTYTAQREYQNYGDRYRQTVYGPGAFIRLFPVNFLFATAQYEYNMIHVKYIPQGNSGNTAYTDNVHANSLLLGAGYAGGRQKGNNTYYFFSISWDVLAEKKSPYVDGFSRSIPIFRAGYNIGLFQGRRSY